MKRILTIIFVVLILISCSNTITEENNGFIMDITDDEILFYAIDGECKYSIDNLDGLDDICLYRNKENHNIELAAYVNIIVDNKGNIKSINEGKDLYQKEYKISDLLKDYENINIKCEDYGMNIDFTLSNDELKEFINSLGDLTIYKDFYKQYGAGGIGCKLTCNKNGASTTIIDEGLIMMIDDEEYGYFFNSSKTLSSIIIGMLE